MNGVANNIDRDFKKRRGVFDRALRVGRFGKRHRGHPESRSDRLTERSGRVYDDGVLTPVGAPTSNNLIIDVEVAKGSVDHLLEGELPSLQVEQFRVVRLFQAFQENRSAVGAKPTRGKGVLLPHQLPGVVEAVANRSEPDASVNECLDEAKLDQIAKPDFYVAFLPRQLG